MSESESRTYQLDLTGKHYYFVDGSRRETPSELFQRFPDDQRLVVLDYAVLPENVLLPQEIWDSRGRFIAHRYVSKDGRILDNIDHHNEPASATENFSTTHQLISAIDEGFFVPEAETQAPIINHDDADSYCALWVATHLGMPDIILTLLADAARAADHTGEAFVIVDIIDVFFRTGNIGTVVELVNQHLRGEKPLFPGKETQEKFDHYQNLARMMEAYLLDILANRESPHGTGFFDKESGILYLEPMGSHIDTVRLLPIIQKLELSVSLIQLSTQGGRGVAGWKISLRSGPSFPASCTLQELAVKLHLEKFGYGGRKNAGGIGRYQGGERIAPVEMYQLLRAGLLAMK